MFGVSLALRSGAGNLCVWRQALTAAAFGAAACLLGSGIALGADADADDDTPMEAEEEAPFPPRDFSTYQPSAKATKVPAMEAPTIDGDLSDPAWQKAEPIDEFYQLDPDTGQPASERTVVRFLYDENNLYIGFYAYDKQAADILATNLSRDGNLGVDDSVRIYLDPLNTRRNSYYFEMNALGAKAEALIQNNTDYIKEWNTIWTGRAKRVEDGFTVEMAIPFSDLSTDPAKPDWVLEISRNLRRRNERIRWTSIAAATQFPDITRAGTLTGITGINPGILDLQLYGSLRYRYDWQNPKREIVSFRGSGNAFYKLTPQLIGTLTVNPDFSDSPLDVLQVNTTRFNLFQPETRNFFLQDVATFEFGGRGFASGFNYNYPPDNAQPFFSRNIGLANGLPVSIMTGAKLSGEYAGLGVGALSTVTNGTGNTKRSQVLSVARVTKPIGESKAGIIVTNGDPTGLTTNTLVGADYQFRNSNFFPDKILQSDFYYQRTFSDKVGDDDSFGLAITYPNEPFGGEAHFKQIGTDFTPALGFVNRPAVRQYDGKWIYRNRNLGWRWFEAGTVWYVVTGLNNHLESLENGIWTGLAFRSNDEIYVRAFDNFEDVPVPFKIAGKLPVPAGRYHWTNFNTYLQTSNGRPYSIRLDVLCCHFYNGQYVRVDLRADLRPGAFLQVAPHYTYSYINMPTGIINIHILASDFIVNFTPDMQLFNQLQYDNVSEKFALSLRFRWEYEPGQELFASLGQAAVIPSEPTFRPQSTQASVRLGHTYRF